MRLTHAWRGGTIWPGAAILLLLVLPGHVPGTQAAEGQAAAGETPAPITLPPEFDRVLRDYEAAWRDGDGERLASLFTEDGFAIQSGRPIARGRAAIGSAIKGPGGPLQLSAYALAVDGSVAHIVGGYGYAGKPTTSGRFVLALRRGADGRWLIAADLDNSGPRQ